MKNLTAVILVAFMLLVFASCGETDGKQLETTAMSDTSLTQFGATSPADNNVSENFKATKEDFDTLTAVTYGIWHSSPHTGTKEGYLHNKDSEYALIEAMYMIYNDSVSLAFAIAECYGIELDWESFLKEYEYTTESFNVPTDPLNMFQTDKPGACGYIRFNADQVDWILENILSITPDRARIYFDLNPYDDDNTPDCYYHEGYYYYIVPEGGGGGNLPTIIDYAQQEDGSYTVKFYTYDEEIEYRNGYQILEVSAVLKELDKKRVWTVSGVNVIEYVVE